MRTFSPVYANPLSFLKDFDLHIDQPVKEQGVGLNSFETKETPEAWLLSIEMPGVREQDLQIEAQDKVITLSGVKYNALDKEDKKDFVKNFKLPDSVDLDAIEAHLEHGVLLVSLPKKMETRSRKIEISVSKPALNETKTTENEEVVTQ